MIAFVVITTILNLGLGYALAVYLGHAQASAPISESPLDVAAAQFAFRLAPEVPAAESIFTQAPGTPKPWPAQPQAEQPGVGYLGLEKAAADTTTAGVMRADPAPDPRDAERPVLRNAAEQDLLAGIEEFRNQLAQLKGQAMAEV